MKTNTICLALLLFWQAMSFSQKSESGIIPNQEQTNFTNTPSSLVSSDLPCDDTSLTLSSTIPLGSTEQYAASNLIESTQTIHNNASATYIAGQLIHLSPGFIAKTGSTFNAYIENCNSTNTITNQFNTEFHSRAISSPPVGIMKENLQTSCYPNPFSNQAIIEFELEKDTDVRLELFDINGKQVQTILNSLKSKGLHKVDLDANELANGIYFVHLKTKQQFSSLKIMIHKK